MSKNYMDQSDIKRNNFVASCFILPDFTHTHDFFELSFGVHGQSTNVINKKPHQFGRGKCAILRPNIDSHYFKAKHSDKNTNQYEHKDIYVKHDRFIEICNTIHPELYEKIMNNPTPICFNISEDFFEFIWQKSLTLAEAMQNKNPYFTVVHTMIITTILSQWLEQELFAQTKYPQWLNDLLPQFNSVEFLTMTITDIAKSVGYSLPYFSSEFKKLMNVSAIKYLNQKRLIFSKQLLAENRMNIIDIAMLLGFANPSTYSKHFLEEYGITPSEYRRQKTKALNHTNPN